LNGSGCKANRRPALISRAFAGMAGVLGPHVSPYSNTCRNDFKLFAALFPDANHLLPAGAPLLFLADVMNGFYPRNIRGQRLSPTFASAMRPDFYRLFCGRLPGLSKEDFLSLVEQQMLAAVFLGEFLRATTEDPTPQKLNLLKVLQRFVLELNLLCAFLLEAGLQVTNPILQLLDALWLLSQYVAHTGSLARESGSPVVLVHTTLR
jgi:hypothetical protein